jgi:hypothetical protein
LGSGLKNTRSTGHGDWRTAFTFDPRLVGEWSFEASRPVGDRLVCATSLPEGVVAYVPPPAEKRIAIGGKFLDEVSIRQSATSFLSFPVGNHRGEIGGDGAVTIHAKMPTIVELFAEGALTPVGGAPMEIMVAGKKLGPMVLAEVRCTGGGGLHDVAILVFRRADAEVSG